jgi:hypothetical protein
MKQWVIDFMGEIPAKIESKVQHTNDDEKELA